METEKWKYEEGYEKKRVVNPASINLAKLKTDKEVIVAYAELSKASHWRKDKTKGNLAWEMSKEIVDEVRKRLESVGWHAHIFKTGSTECKCHADMYLHSTFGMPSIHQVPFSKEWNTELTEQELFDKIGNLKSIFETLKLLRKRIGEETLNLDNMVKTNEIAEETSRVVKEIMEEEGLLELHELDEDNKTFRSGSREYTWRNSETEAEEEAREYLEDGELWRMAVEAEQTDLGLQEWIDLVLDTDGWAHVLCGYDSISHDLEDGQVYWRTN